MESQFVLLRSLYQRTPIDSSPRRGANIPRHSPHHVEHGDDIMKFSFILPLRAIHYRNGTAIGYSRKADGKTTHFQTISVGSSATEHGGRIIQYRNGNVVGYSRRTSLMRTKHYNLNGKCIGESHNFLLFIIHRGHVWGVDQEDKWTILFLSNCRPA